MNLKKWFVLLFVFIGAVLVLAVMPNYTTKVVEAQGCSGQLTMEPTDPYSLGTHVILRGTSNCGTVRFEIRNPSTGQSWTKAETGQPNQTETWKTEEFGSGTFEVCFVARGGGGWENAHRSCRTVFVEGSQAPPPGSEPGQQVRCWVNSFVATPATVQIGQNINLASQGQCDGNMRAARYMIDGQGWGEHATTTYNTGWDTSGYVVGTHRLCYQITGGDWADAAESCVNVTLQSETAPPPSVVSGDQNTNDIPGQTEDSNPSMIDHPQGDPPSGSDGVCPANKPDNLSVGMIAVTVDRVNLREQPDSNSNRIMRIPRGTLVTIIGGPICNRGQRWQHVGHDGQQGWVLENEGRGYWLVPNGSVPATSSDTSSDSDSSNSLGQTSQSSSQPNNSCAGAIAPHMQVGQRGRVTYTDGSPTNLRNQPGGSVLMAMPEGFEFMVVGGPTCLNDLRWWQLRTDSGTTGWSPEGRNGMYWIEPWSGSSGSTPQTNSGSSNPPRDTNASQCYKAMSPLFSVGSIGQVAINDGIGSHIQAAPSQRPDLLFLNEGQQFTVVGGPTCADGFRWWQVTAQGATGWIAEGDENGYWLGRVTAHDPAAERPTIEVIDSPWVVNSEWDGVLQGRVSVTVENTGTSLILRTASMEYSVDGKISAICVAHHWISVHDHRGQILADQGISEIHGPNMSFEDAYAIAPFMEVSSGTEVKFTILWDCANALELLHEEAREAGDIPLSPELEGEADGELDTISLFLFE